MISANKIVVQGSGKIEADGDYILDEQGGAGSGGSVYLRANTLDVGIGKVTATGGTATGVSPGGEGGEGRIRFDFIDRGISESDPNAYKYQL